MDVMAELQAIFKDIFDDDKLIVTSETSAANVKSWDSLSHIRLVAAVEKHFEVRFSLLELKDLKNAGDMAALIARKLEKQKSEPLPKSLKEQLFKKERTESILYGKLYINYIIFQIIGEKFSCMIISL